jgi:hypothetical protein
MRPSVVFALIAVLVSAARLCHSGVLWADDTLPLAAALELIRGKALYRDVWFDKPPLVAWINLLWAAQHGWLLRLAGSAYVVFASWIAFQAARIRWGAREGIAAACLLAFFLTFGLPSAVIPVASDMLLIAPHLAAIAFAWAGHPLLAGIIAGTGLLASSKAIFVLLACFLCISGLRQYLFLLAGFLIPHALTLVWMIAHGSATDYFLQAWQWGSIYAANTFVDNPFREGIVRTINWAGFHSALVIGALWCLRRGNRRDLGWLILALGGVTLGLRFFPRYYFLLLVPMTLFASRGWCEMIARRRNVAILLMLLLAIPAIRFGPRYIQLLRGEPWGDLRLDEDSRAVGALLHTLKRPGDTLFVWGFRPEIFVYSGIPAGTRFLESQPLSGVLADRHLSRSDAVAADFLRANRAEVLRTRPTLIVDSLGILNRALSLTEQDDFGYWLSAYQEVGRTDFSVIYRLR